MGGRPTLLLAALLLGNALADQPPALAEVSELALPDHRGGQDRVANHRGAPVMVMIVDAKRLRLIKDWERDLRERFPDLAIVRIADRPADSDATVAEVQDKYRGRLPEDLVVLIDIDRRWSTALDLDTGRPCLLLLDAEGALVGAWRSRFTERLAAEVRAAVAGLVDDP
jgi:predicted GTPase